MDFRDLRERVWMILGIGSGLVAAVGASFGGAPERTPRQEVTYERLYEVANTNGVPGLQFGEIEEVYRRAKFWDDHDYASEIGNVPRLPELDRDTLRRVIASYESGK